MFIQGRSCLIAGWKPLSHLCVFVTIRAVELRTPMQFFSHSLRWPVQQATAIIYITRKAIKRTSVAVYSSPNVRRTHRVYVVAGRSRQHWQNQLTENAGIENAGASKIQGCESQSRIFHPCIFSVSHWHWRYAAWSSTWVTWLHQEVAHCPYDKSHLKGMQYVKITQGHIGNRPALFDRLYVTL